MGDDDFPYWLMAVRVNVLLFLVCLAAVAAWSVFRRRRGGAAPGETALVIALTAVAGALRFALASANLLDLGGIPYSRMLLGYRGHFAAAQLYSIFYELTARDIEHAILFNRLAGTLSVPALYWMCAAWERRRTHFPAIAALLLAVSPMHCLFSASDSLAIATVFLTAVSYALLLAAPGVGHPAAQFAHYLGGFSGLALLTQVRYENAIFLLPAAWWLATRRPRGVGAAAAAVPMALIGSYAWQTAAAGISYQTPLHLPTALAMVWEQFALNPFAGLALLGAGSAAAAVRGGWRWGWTVAVLWAAAVAAALPGGSGLGAARNFTSWLVWIVPTSAWGLAWGIESRRGGWRFAAGTVLVVLALQPLLFSRVLRRTHLEIVEHVHFQEAVRSLPDGVDAVIVPDDEPLRRRAGSTVELMTRYTMALATMRPPLPVRLVGLTDYLERPSSTACRPGACAFYFGLPCTPQNAYPFTRDSCLALLQSRPTTVLSERNVSGAPFVACATFAGRLAAAHCLPAAVPRTFALHLLDVAPEPEP